MVLVPPLLSTRRSVLLRMSKEDLGNILLLYYSGVEFLIQYTNPRLLKTVMAFASFCRITRLSFTGKGNALWMVEMGRVVIITPGIAIYCHSSLKIFSFV